MATKIKIQNHPNTLINIFKFKKQKRTVNDFSLEELNQLGIINKSKVSVNNLINSLEQNQPELSTLDKGKGTFKMINLTKQPSKKILQKSTVNLNQKTNPSITTNFGKITLDFPAQRHITPAREFEKYKSGRYKPILSQNEISEREQNNSKQNKTPLDGADITSIIQTLTDIQEQPLKALAPTKHQNTSFESSPKNAKNLSPFLSSHSVLKENTASKLAKDTNRNQLQQSNLSNSSHNNSNLATIKFVSTKKRDPEMTKSQKLLSKITQSSSQKQLLTRGDIQMRPNVISKRLLRSRGGDRAATEAGSQSNEKSTFYMSGNFAKSSSNFNKTAKTKFQMTSSSSYTKLNFFQDSIKMDKTEKIKGIPVKKLPEILGFHIGPKKTKNADQAVKLQMQVRRMREQRARQNTVGTSLEKSFFENQDQAFSINFE